MCIEVQNEIKDNVKMECSITPKGKKRTKVQKEKEIELIVKELQSANVFKYIPGRQYTAFPSFQDVFSRVKMDDLSKWFEDQKKRADFEMT